MEWFEWRHYKLANTISYPIIKVILDLPTTVLTSGISSNRIQKNIRSSFKGSKTKKNTICHPKSKYLQTTLTISGLALVTLYIQNPPVKTAEVNGVLGRLWGSKHLLRRCLDVQGFEITVVQCTPKPSVYSKYV